MRWMMAPAPALRMSISSCRPPPQMPEASCSIWNSAIRFCGRIPMCSWPRPASNGCKWPWPGHARDVLRAVVDSAFDVSDTALPYMGFANVTLGGIAARLFRISFCGELAFEIAVGASYGAGLAGALIAAGAAHGIVPTALRRRT